MIKYKKELFVPIKNKIDFLYHKIPRIKSSEDLNPISTGGGGGGGGGRIPPRW